MSPCTGAWPPAWPSSSAALDRQLQHVAAAGAHGAGQLVDGATRFVNAAAARRGRSRATSARQRRPALQVDTFPASMRRARLQLLDVPAAPTWCALSRTGQLASNGDLFCECRPGRARGHRPGHHRAGLDHQLQHGAGQLVDGTTRFVNAAAARRGRSRATSADLVRALAHRPARQQWGSVL